MAASKNTNKSKKKTERTRTGLRLDALKRAFEDNKVKPFPTNLEESTVQMKRNNE
jgi:hypothetical protein